MNDIDYAGGYASNALLGKLSGGVPDSGHVSFTRGDGVANIQISSSLTAEASAKLETFLRELIAEDRPKLESVYRAKVERKISEQRRYRLGIGVGVDDAFQTQACPEEAGRPFDRLD